MLTMSDFGKEVAGVYKDLKKTIEGKTVTTGSPYSGSIDRSVKEEVISDLDRLIEKNEKR